MEKEKSCLSWSELGFSQTAPWSLLLETYTATVLKDITFKINTKKEQTGEKQLCPQGVTLAAAREAPLAKSGCVVGGGYIYI